MGFAKKRPSAKVAVFAIALALGYVVVLSAMMFVGSVKLGLFGKTEYVMKKELCHYVSDIGMRKMMKKEMFADALRKPVTAQEAGRFVTQHPGAVLMKNGKINEMWLIAAVPFLIMALSPFLLLRWD